MNRYVAIEAGYHDWAVGEIRPDGTIVTLAKVQVADLDMGAERGAGSRERAERIASALNWFHDMAPAGGAR